MRELEALLNKRWILKAEDKELYTSKRRRQIAVSGYSCKHDGPKNSC